MTPAADSLLGWLLTYWIHSTALLAGGVGRHPPAPESGGSRSRLEDGLGRGYRHQCGATSWRGAGDGPLRDSEPGRNPVVDADAEPADRRPGRAGACDGRAAPGGARSPVTLQVIAVGAGAGVADRGGGAAVFVRRLSVAARPAAWPPPRRGASGSGTGAPAIGDSGRVWPSRHAHDCPGVTEPDRDRAVRDLRPRQSPDPTSAQ